MSSRRNATGFSKDDHVRKLKKQGKGSQKKNATLTTVALKMTPITSVIDANKRRDVSVVNIPGVLLATDMDDDVIIIPQERLEELMVKNQPIIY